MPRPSKGTNNCEDAHLVSPLLKEEGMSAEPNGVVKYDGSNNVGDH